MACLVQQLFRQKIGVELDPNVLDEVLFPLLRLKKHGPKELLQDIKLTSDILVTTEPWRPHTFTRAVLPFTEKTEYWDYMEQFAHVSGGRGRHTSKFRRKKIGRADWGTIDILNELRGLNYPQAGYKPRPYVILEPDSFEDAYISLAEDNSLPAPIRWGTDGIVDHSRQNAVLIDSRSQFVNNFLDDVLITGKRLNWTTTAVARERGILSIVESSQQGEVQSQLY